MAHGLSGCAARGNFPDQGWNPWPLRIGRQILNQLDHQQSSHITFLKDLHVIPVFTSLTKKKKKYSETFFTFYEKRLERKTASSAFVLQWAAVKWQHAPTSSKRGTTKLHIEPHICALSSFILCTIISKMCPKANYTFAFCHLGLWMGMFYFWIVGAICIDITFRAVLSI